MPFLLFLYPVTEILLWISFVSRFGFVDALLWCATSAAVGVIIMRMQGAAAFQELQKAANRGELPSPRITHHILMSLGGILLILPGVVTDILGALIILPGTRHLMVWWIYKKTGGKLKQSFSGFAFKAGGFGGGFSQPRDVGSSGDIIDIKATHINDNPAELKKPTPKSPPRAKK